MHHSRDLAAFIAISLEKIFETVETSVVAWEKKGYWVKADRFRLEWEWSKNHERALAPGRPGGRLGVRLR